MGDRARWAWLACALATACDAAGAPDAGDAGRLDASWQDATVDPRDGGRLDASSLDAGTRDASSDASRDGAPAGDGGLQDGGMVDAGWDAGWPDSGPPDAGPRDSGPRDSGPRDSGPRDSGPPDAGPRDSGPPDAGPPDSGRDSGPPDAGPRDAGPTPPPGLSTPCASGPGWTLFRFHYDGSTSPSIDVWDATCSYSYAPSSACNVVAVGSTSLVMSGTALGLDGSDYIRVRFSVTGLSFTSAAVYVQARSYSTSASTNIRVWSPLYGERAMGPVDNDWVYDWYGMDWSDKLYPTDSRASRRSRSTRTSAPGSLAVRAVELCVDD
ncbi:MAG: hypothetical protein M5U28_47475 [Sandaracinaceae bacterium]|nr:hypothetical protein [Sandaracinaceae bacterium]